MDALERGLIMNEAAVRIKINDLLRAAGWRFEADHHGPANILVEQSTQLKEDDPNAPSPRRRKARPGFIDYLLLNEKGFPFIVLEAKADNKHPLVGKEQAREYAHSQKCRFVILSNGTQHYLWDVRGGQPELLPAIPLPASIEGYHKEPPYPGELVGKQIGEDFVVRTQRPKYDADAAWQSAAERPGYINANKLRFLRPYQEKALRAIQDAVKSGKKRFLFEMATGTGKTLTAAAIIKLFLKSGNAQRVLFLVDRIELEEQARRALHDALSQDYSTIIFKENHDNWRHAEIVVSTVQALLSDDKYKTVFSPTDFDFVISDEAHRSIRGNARAVFEHFVGYKLGLTATPRDFLKNFDQTNMSDPRELERRLLLDTYETFGCKDSQPTFRYTLPEAVNEGYLVNPIVVDARTEVTAQLLSEKGFVAEATDVPGQPQQGSYQESDFERRFFSEPTNQLFCRTFLENALCDPISKEIGKSIIFAVSQPHARKLVDILNRIADKMFPGKYQSDFAVQVTSEIPGAQQFAMRFANNSLHGFGNFIPEYKTSKARVCVTFGMMTTGYDCPDILNLGLFRPIFSPTDFIQIKGRGTRKHDFLDELRDQDLKDSLKEVKKTGYKLFDFFANCEFFEEKFSYDQPLKLPAVSSTAHRSTGGGGQADSESGHHHRGEDVLATIRETDISREGLRVDQMFFEKFAGAVLSSDSITKSVAAGDWERAADYVVREMFGKPSEFYDLDRLRKAAGVDRRLTVREVLEKVFGVIPRFKSKDELLEEEFARYLAAHKPDDAQSIPDLKTFFKAYITSEQVRQIIDTKQFTGLATNAVFSTRNLKAVPRKYHQLIPEYINANVSLDRFAD